MIIIYKLGENFKFSKYDTWDNGEFSGPLSGLDIKEEDIEKRFNTSYYRTGNGENDETEKKAEKKAEKIEINLGEL